jgi:hypothetical protein
MRQNGMVKCVVVAALSLASACKDAPAKSPQQAGGVMAKPTSAGSTAPSAAGGGAGATDARVASADAALDAGAARDANAAPDANAMPDASGARDASTGLDEDASPADASTSVTFTFVSIVWGSNDSPAGTSFCHEDALTECAIADSTGTAVVHGLPPEKPYLLRVTKDGFVPEIKHFLTWNTDGSESFTRLIRRDVLERWAASRGVTLDPSKGHIAFFALGGAGGDLKVSSTSGTTLLNFNSMDAPEPSLEQIGTTGFGLVLNVDPGMHDVVVTRAGYKCAFGMETGWPGSEPTISGVLIKPGLLSAFAFVVCTPQSP